MRINPSLTPNFKTLYESVFYCLVNDRKALHRRFLSVIRSIVEFFVHLQEAGQGSMCGKSVLIPLPARAFADVQNTAVGSPEGGDYVHGRTACRRARRRRLCPWKDGMPPRRKEAVMSMEGRYAAAPGGQRGGDTALDG